MLEKCANCIPAHTSDKGNLCTPSCPTAAPVTPVLGQCFCKACHSPSLEPHLLGAISQLETKVFSSDQHKETSETADTLLKRGKFLQYRGGSNKEIYTALPNAGPPELCRETLWKVITGENRESNKRNSALVSVQSLSYQCEISHLYLVSTGEGLWHHEAVVLPLLKGKTMGCKAKLAIKRPTHTLSYLHYSLNTH